MVGVEKSVGIANIIITPEKHFTRKHWTLYLNASPNKTQKTTRKHGKSYLLSTRRRAFSIRGREHKEKCNVKVSETFHSRYFYGKRSYLYGKWSLNPLVTLVFI